jgi:hypothetical protein
VKVLANRPTAVRLPWRASVTALASALVALLGLLPTTAHAITRTAVLDRAHGWVAKKVRYSQSSSFAGYRRDCSGFVSMAWKLGRSYTSRTIQAVAVRIPLSHLRPGDAVHTPGHVAIFVKWANKARTAYVAMEESSWGRPALHHVRSLGRGATALRYRGIQEAPLVAAELPLTGASAVPTGSPLADAAASLATTTPAYTEAAPVALLATATASFTSTDTFSIFFPAPAFQLEATPALAPLAY